MFSVTAAGEKRAYKFLARWAYLCCVFTACAQQTPSCDCLTMGLFPLFICPFCIQGCGGTGQVARRYQAQNRRTVGSFFGCRIASSSFERKQLYQWNFALCTYYLVSCVSCNSMVSQIMLSSFIQPKFRSVRAMARG